MPNSQNIEDSSKEDLRYDLAILVGLVYKEANDGLDNTIYITDEILNRFAQHIESIELPEKKPIHWCPSENCHYNQAIDEATRTLQQEAKKLRKVK